MPIIGVTAGVEWREGSEPYRPVLLSDSKLHDALSRYGAAPVMLAHEKNAVEAYVARLDGVLIAGGGYQFPDEDNLVPDAVEAVSDRDRIYHRRARFELNLARGALAHGLPLLGVCGGFQVLNQVNGGRLITSLERSVPGGGGHLVLPADRLAHTVDVDAESLLYRLTGQARFEVNSLHRQGVQHTGPDILVAARAEDGLVEAIEVRSSPFALGVQWHPEFLLTDADEKLIAGFVAACCAHRESRI
jgi:putative glutamine amidotransferase